MKSLRSALIGFTAAGLLALPGAATATTPADRATPAPLTVAQAAPSGFNTTVRFLDFDHSRRYGKDVRIRGQVLARVGDRRGAVKGVHVRLYRKINGNTRWVHLETRRTNERRHPSFRFQTRARANASYRVVFRGNAQLQRSRRVTGVTVYRLFNARLEDGSGRFHGRVVPRYGHHVISLDKRNCAKCSWRQVATTTTADRGRYSFKVGAPRTGRYYWRLQTPRSLKYKRSYSGVFTTERR